MAGAPIRDPLADHLLTPENAALVVIDYQPSQFAAVRSMDPDLLLDNIVSTVKTAKAFGVPIVHSTVNVASGRQQPTVPELADLLEDNPPVDRTTLNAWEDADFVAAVRHRAAQADHQDQVTPPHLPGGKPGSGPPPGGKFQQWIDMGERAWSAAKPTQPKGNPP